MSGRWRLPGYAMSETGETSTDNMRREILIAEYKALREEMVKRMDHRVTFRVSALALTLTATAVGVERRSGVLLLLAPIVTILLSNIATYISLRIDRIAGYIRSNIEPELNRLASRSAGWHRFDGDRPSQFRRMLVQYHVPILLLVLVPTVVAVGLGWVYEDSVSTSALITAIDVALLAMFAWNYYRSEIASSNELRDD